MRNLEGKHFLPFVLLTPLMSILVVCPSCFKRFQVSEKFAGKSGNCPNCKKPITVPTAEQEVKIHTPEEFGGGGRGATGKLALKPITRQETKYTPLFFAGVAGTAVLMFAFAWLGGGVFQMPGATGYLLTAVALTLISPLLSWAAYGFLYNDELEPYKGAELYLRTGACGLAYAILWACFTYAAPIFLSEEVWRWLMLAPPFFVVGTVIAAAALDLEIGNAFFHYAFYLAVTVLLRGVAGLGWVWQMKGHG
jgi:hypothetical protein